jgi:hypothetical protein
MRAMSDGASTGASDATRQVVRRIVITLLLLLAAAMVWYSASLKGAPESPSLTDAAVERLIPASDTPSAIRQSEIGIDLATGWEADLVINGVSIPEDEERRNEPLNEVFFTPGKGKVIEALAPGLVQVTAIIWRPIDGQTRDSGSRPVTWSFHVA